MKLIGELKKQVESTATKEEAKDVIANAGMELTNEELDDVVGGSTPYNFIKEAFDKLSEEEREKQTYFFVDKKNVCNFAHSKIV